jgi:hypothetical protein
VSPLALIRAEMRNRNASELDFSERAHLNTLVFFAPLGGVEAFGVIGLFIGPVVLSFTHVVLEMLRETNLDQPTAGGRSGGDFNLADRRQMTRRAAISGTER